MLNRLGSVDGILFEQLHFEIMECLTTRRIRSEFLRSSLVDEGDIVTIVLDLFSNLHWSESDFGIAAFYKNGYSPSIAHFSPAVAYKTGQGNKL